MWYNISNNTSGIISFIYAVRDGMGSQVPIIGENFFGMSILITLFMLIFLPIARSDVWSGFIAASFLCWIVSVFLMAIQLVHVDAFIITTIIFAASTIIYYLQTRH